MDQGRDAAISSRTAVFKEEAASFGSSAFMMADTTAIPAMGAMFPTLAMEESMFLTGTEMVFSISVAKRTGRRGLTD